MAIPKKFAIKESDQELCRLIYSSGPIFKKRLMAMRLFKEHGSTGISKRVVAKALGLDPGQVGKWRNMYIPGGIEGLLVHGKKGNRPSEIAPNHDALREKLEDPYNGYRVSPNFWIGSTPNMAHRSTIRHLTST